MTMNRSFSSPSISPIPLQGLAGVAKQETGVENIIGPLTIRGADAHRYIPAEIGIIVTTAFACVMTVVLMMYYAWENKRRDNSP